MKRTESRVSVLSRWKRVTASGCYTFIGAEHLLLGLIRQEKGVAARTLRAFGMQPEMVEGLIG